MSESLQTRNIADDDLRRALRLAQDKTRKVIVKLDAVKSQRALELADEALECLQRAEHAYFATTRARPTEAVRLAVERARRASRERRRDRGSL